MTENETGNDIAPESNPQVAALQRELLGLQEMLAMVLRTVGEPVVVTKAALAGGFRDGTQIGIDETDEAFVFSLDEPDA